MRVQRGAGAGSASAAWRGQRPPIGGSSAGRSLPPCDLILFSEAAPRFSIDRALPHLPGGYAVVVWVSEACVAEQGEKASPACNFLNTMWEKTALMRTGYCLQGVCISRVSTDRLRDPNALPLDCADFSTAEGSRASIGEFGQDWYLFWNFLRPGAASGSAVAEGD